MSDPTNVGYLLEMNSTRVQSDLMARVEESQDQMEAEIRKVVHEITRVATAVLEHARGKGRVMGPQLSRKS